MIQPETILCPKCHQPMDTDVQPWSHREPSILVTCRTEGCTLMNVTATTEDMDATFAPFLVEADNQRLDNILDDARFSDQWQHGLRPNVPI